MICPGLAGPGNGPAVCHSYKENDMLRWALIFFVVALLAALFGFGGIAGTAAGIAKVLFIAFLVIAALALIAGLVGRGKSI